MLVELAPERWKLSSVDDKVAVLCLGSVVKPVMSHTETSRLSNVHQ